MNIIKTIFLSIFLSVFLFYPVFCQDIPICIDTAGQNYPDVVFVAKP